MQRSTYMCMHFLFHVCNYSRCHPILSPSYWKTLEWITEDQLLWMRDHDMVSKQIQHALLSGLPTHNWSQNWKNAASLFPHLHWKNTRSVAYGMKKGNARLNEATHFLWPGNNRMDTPKSERISERKHFPWGLPPCLETAGGESVNPGG